MARILQVFRPRTGGTFAHVCVLAEELANRGHEVALCGPPGTRDLPAKLIPVSIPRAADPLAAMSAVREVGRAYREFEPDLIHAHGAQAGVVARLARAARPGTPLVHTPHRYAFEDGRGRTFSNLAFRAVERALMPLATAVICVSEHERQLAVGLGAGERAEVVYNGIDPLPDSAIPPAVAEFSSGADGLIVAVSELFVRKGVEVLMAAMQEVIPAHPGARLVVAGDGPDRAQCEEAIRRSGIGSSVFLAGQVDGVGGLLRAADVFVNPALAEGFPYAVLEAMAAGCGCVVTDAGGTAEAVEDGRSGLVVPVGDSSALANGILTLLEDPELRSEYGQEASARVRGEFNRGSMIAETIRIYDAYTADHE